jgi:anaerobic magnesium-protoporphyrin IX monomethyl ester cyclase
MKILLTTLHAKYIHASLALPCLKAATSEIKGIRSVIREFTVNEHRSTVLRELVAEKADVVAFSCYIWNIEAILRIAADLKKLRPETLLVAGGPEVSYSAEEFLRDNRAFDCVICGEGEKTWQEFLAQLGEKRAAPILSKTIPAGIAFRDITGIVAAREREAIEDLDDIPSPFALDLVDTTKPLVYYETSRGCPFSCAFCLSSREKGVRSFSRERIHSDILSLIQKDVQVVKLVDRTFNYDAGRANEIWDFILTHNRSSTFHFEISADLLTEENIRTLARVPAGMFRFEIGVQATGKETLSRVSRKSDPDRLLAAVKRLTEETGVTVHLDLVAGLPGEDFSGFLASLDRLFAVNPHHIQVEPLKILKGSPMVEIAIREGYAFSATPPYTILRTSALSFDEIGQIEEISRLLDLYYNSRRFTRSLAAVENHLALAGFFDKMASFIKKEPGTGQVSLKYLFELMWRFGNEILNPAVISTFRDALCYDFCLGEYPSAGLLPSFFTGEGKALRSSLPRQTIDATLATLEIPSGSRVRTFTARFRSDYRTIPATEGPVELIFVYLSSAGRGLRVEVFPLNQPQPLPESDSTAMIQQQPQSPYQPDKLGLKTESIT